MPADATLSADANPIPVKPVQSSPERAYDVGYGKPPEKTRFNKGPSAQTTTGAAEIAQRDLGSIRRRTLTPPRETLLCPAAILSMGFAPDPAGGAARRAEALVPTVQTASSRRHRDMSTRKSAGTPSLLCP